MAETRTYTTLGGREVAVVLGPPTARQRRAPDGDADLLSADVRRTMRNHELLERGVHPATGRLLLAQLPDVNDTCGRCTHHNVHRRGNKVVHKCTEHRLGESFSAASDIRVSWPACALFEAIVEGDLTEVPALEEREEFSLDGVTYEAFNTSGGLGTLCETLKDKVRTLNYRTIRYPGHAAIMKALLNDLGLRHRREVLKDILENALPTTMQDVVIVFVTVSGRKDGRLVQETYAHKVYAAPIAGKLHSAIQITTAGSICAVLDMLAAGTLPARGFVKQEEISLDAFLANRFGSYYAKDEQALRSA